MNNADIPALVNLYHLANTALINSSQYERMCWAVEQYGKANPSVKGTYKALDKILQQ